MCFDLILNSFAIMHYGSEYHSLWPITFRCIEYNRQVARQICLLGKRLQMAGWELVVCCCLRTFIPRYLRMAQSWNEATHWTVDYWVWNVCVVNCILGIGLWAGEFAMGVSISRVFIPPILHSCFLGDWFRVVILFEMNFLFSFVISTSLWLCWWFTTQFRTNSKCN